MPTVARFSVTPVKGLKLLHPDTVEVTAQGIRGDRVLYLAAAEDGRMLNGKAVGELVQVEARLDDALDVLTLRFPGGETVAGDVRGALGAAVETSFYGRPVTGRVVEGPLAAALSEAAGRAVLLVRADEPGAACDVLHPLSVLSRASCAELARQSGDARLADDRRFRMHVLLDGLGAPHEEDGWAGRTVRLGEAAVAVQGPIGRCAITAQDPDTGRPDGTRTLEAIKAYRGMGENGTMCFGMYTDVVRPGRIAVGDPVVVDDDDDGV